MSIQFHTPGRCQGQIVERSYGLTESGLVVECRYDRSDRSIAYMVATARDEDEGEYWNGEPEIVGEWREPTANERRKYDLYDGIAEAI